MLTLIVLDEKYRPFKMLNATLSPRDLMPTVVKGVVKREWRWVCWYNGNSQNPTFNNHQNWIFFFYYACQHIRQLLKVGKVIMSSENYKSLTNWPKQVTDRDDWLAQRVSKTSPGQRAALYVEPRMLTCFVMLCGWLSQYHNRKSIL